MARKSEVISKFYELACEEFDLTEEQVTEICKAPFKFIAEQMAVGDMKPYRLQNFGTFFIPPTRMRFAKKSLDEKLQNGLISEVRYNNRKETLNKYEEEDHT